MATFDFSVKPVETLRNDMDRLTILRFLLDTPPVVQLINLMNELLSDDALPFDIQWAYHDFAGAVLAGTPSVVTGDRWRDCLIEAVLERENAFSLAAARGRADDVLQRAFSRDLGIVQTLFLLDDSMIRNWCTPSQHGADLSGWASFSNMNFYIIEGDGPLSAMRRMLLSSEDWSQLASPLMNVHAQSGAGASLGCRYLEFTPEGLLPIERVNPASGEPDGRILDLIGRFVMGESVSSAVVTGPYGLLAVRQALAATSATAVVLRDVSLYPGLCERLEGTRTRYVAVLPAPHPVDPLLCDLLGEGFVRPPENILPILLSPVSDPMLTDRLVHIPAQPPQ